MREMLRFWRDVGLGALKMAGEGLLTGFLWLFAVMLFESFTPRESMDSLLQEWKE